MTSSGRNFRRGILLSNLSKTVSTYSDVELSCRDGVVKWSKFLLAANSNFLREVFILGDQVILPDVSSATLASMLKCTVNFAVRSDVLSVNELEVMRLLGFDLEAVRTRKFQEEQEEEPPPAPSDKQLVGLLAKVPLALEFLPDEDEEEDEQSVSHFGDDDDDVDVESSSAHSSSSSASSVCSRSSKDEEEQVDILSINDSSSPLPGPLPTLKDIEASSVFNEDSERSLSIPSPLVINEEEPTKVVTENNNGDEIRKRSNNDSNLICRYCDKKFQRADNLKVHIKFRHETVDADKIFKCNECGAKFNRIQHLEHHASNHQRDKKYICDLCGKIFFHQSYLEKHKNYHEDRNMSHKCDKCGEAFKGKRSLKHHVNSRHSEVQCHECGIQIPKNKLKGHLEDVHGIGSDEEDDEGKVYCHICKKGFSSPRTLLIHRRFHEGLNGHIEVKEKKVEVEKYINCETCSKLFASKAQLKLHVSNVHKAVAVKCDTCGKMVKHLPNHVKMMHDKSKKKVPLNLSTPCLDCGKMFTTPYAAKYHHLKVHANTPVKEAPCKFCGKKYGNLARHLKEVHAENRYECDFCGKFFPVRYSLERHVRNVHNPRQLPCPYCDIRVIHLSMHLISAHQIPSEKIRKIVKQAEDQDDLEDEVFT